MNEQKAFNSAFQKIGPAHTVQNEFEKVKETQEGQKRKLFEILFLVAALGNPLLVGSLAFFFQKRKFFRNDIQPANVEPGCGCHFFFARLGHATELPKIFRHSHQTSQGRHLPPCSALVGGPGLHYYAALPLRCEPKRGGIIVGICSFGNLGRLALGRRNHRAEESCNDCFGKREIIQCRKLDLAGSRYQNVSCAEALCADQVSRTAIYVGGPAHLPLRVHFGTV
jgi:hypothetical protein